MDSNQLDLALAKQLGVYSRLGEKEMHSFINQAESAILEWKKPAGEIGVSRGEQILMVAAFRMRAIGAHRNY